MIIIIMHIVLYLNASVHVMCVCVCVCVCVFQVVVLICFYLLEKIRPSWATVHALEGQFL